jgi:hypothetical protein
MSGFASGAIKNVFVIFILAGAALLTKSHAVVDVAVRGSRRAGRALGEVWRPGSSYVGFGNAFEAGGHRQTKTGPARNQFRTASPGALSSGGCGLAKPIVPGCASLLVYLVSTLRSVVIKAASTATVSATAKIATALRRLFQWLLIAKPLTLTDDVGRLGLVLSPTHVAGT